jgi:hypothetical protein
MRLGLLSAAVLAFGAFVAAPAFAHPPDCAHATASPIKIWPPNHKMVLVTINVPDVDNDQIVTVTTVTQDEPLMTTGSGHTTPDAQRVPVSGHTGKVYVRAERKGNAPTNGRVYRISFTATDAQYPNDPTHQCTGSVTVGVPHDQGGRSTPIDDGQLYNSFG